MPTESFASIFNQAKYSLITITSLVFECLLKVATERADTYRMVAKPNADECYRWFAFANQLLARGASIDLGYIDDDTIFNRFAAHYHDNNNCKLVVELLIGKLHSPNRTGYSGKNALFQAVVNHLPMHYVNMLLDNGAELNTLTTHGLYGFVECPKRSVLSAALEAKNYPALAELLRRGASPNQEITQDNKQHLQYANLTPYQTAVLAGDKKAIQIIVSHCDAHNIELLTTLTPAEARRRTDCKSNFVSGQIGVHTLENQSLAAIQQLETNLLLELKNKIGLNVYLDQNEYPELIEKLESALSWLFNNASGTAAAKLWAPVLNCVRQETQSNPDFKLTVLNNKKFVGCYNNETQSDIYITPSLNSSYEYRKVVAHEFGHLYMFKRLSWRQQNLFGIELESDIPNITALIHDVEVKHFERKPIDPVMRLLSGILKPISAYPEGQSREAEYFTRLLVEFPIAFASLPFLTRISDYHQNEAELYEVMRKVIPNTFEWYCNSVLKQPDLGKSDKYSCRLM